MLVKLPGVATGTMSPDCSNHAWDQNVPEEESLFPFERGMRKDLGKMNFLDKSSFRRVPESGKHTISK